MKSLMFTGGDDGRPMRLVKRGILLDAGLPIDDSLHTFTAPAEVSQIVDHLGGHLPQLLVLSLPGPYHLPPFYSVDAQGRVNRRDIDGAPPPQDLTALAAELRQLPDGTLIDLVAPLWEDGVVAARFMYASEREQRLEAGVRCQPREIGLSHAGPSIQWMLDGFLPVSADSVGGAPTPELLDAGVHLLRCMADHADGMRRLAEVAPYPTLEMAYHPRRGVIVIDLDWPAQWVGRQDDGNHLESARSHRKEVPSG